MSTALGIAPDSDGNGVDPFTHRKIIQARWDSTGIVTGLGITRTTGLTYQIAAGVAVCSRSDSDGFTEAYYAGGTVTTTAGPSSGSRFDVVWIKADDLTQGDSDNLVTVGVTSGTAASSPSVPSLPTGALALGTFLVPQAMTATSSATVAENADYAIPFGGSHGVLFQQSDKNNSSYGPTLSSGSAHDWISGSIHLATDRLVSFRIDGNMRCVGGSWAQVSYWPRVDGVNICRFNGDRIQPDQWISTHFEITTVVKAGDHQVSLGYAKTGGDGDAQGTYEGPGGLLGTTLTVFDEGVA